MAESSNQPSTDPFPNTRWTLLQNLSAGGAPAQRALEELCTIYWRPVYAYARGSGLTPEDAEDVTQGFFAQLIRRDSLASISSARGRLRCYLLHSLKHFRIDLHRRQNAQRRGGGTYAISIDTSEAEYALATELADHDSPEKIFERRWALALLHEAFTRLEADYAKTDKSALYEHLRPSIIDGPNPVATYADIAAELDMTPGAVQVAAHRLRKKFRRTLEATIAETVESQEEIDAELRHVLGALAS